jgi:hypothetical protein
MNRGEGQYPGYLTGVPRTHGDEPVSAELDRVGIGVTSIALSNWA